MNPDRWRQVQNVLYGAIELPEERQEDYIKECCAEDASLYAEVAALLEAHRKASTFIESPAIHGFPKDWPDGLVGAQFGAYQLQERIGEGGMGAVYRAERNDGQFTQQVAVKLVQPGLGSQELLRRLRGERQILASLNHPNIARLLDGGVSADGQPYVVMEYIRGARITEYCRNHGLTVEQRLRLFQEICLAVSYAHQHLVVHRDIKPSNILVADDGVPKLLDFGIAKILGPSSGSDGEKTQLNPLTPDYASPEQLQGKAITTATDIYSLGVLLYELLTSQKPYKLKDKTPLETMQLVCDTDPERPSAVVSSGENGAPALGNISSDLDAIVLKAMRKEPEQRYRSVEKLSEDIGNFLAARPVGAQQGNWRYVTKKFMRRHRVGVFMSAAVAALLVAGISAVLWEAHLARVERARAERRFNDVRKLANSLIFEVHDGVANLPGSTPVRKLIMQRSAEYLDSLSKDAAGDAGLQVELANAYIRLAQVQGSTNAANLGDLAGAEQTYAKAQTLLGSVLAKEPLRDDANGLFARSSRALASLYLGTHRPEKAAEAANKALAINQGLASRHPGNDVYVEALANALYTLADIQSGTGNLEAANNRAKALELYEQLLARHPDDPDKQRNLALAEKTTGAHLAINGSVQEALSHYQRALELDDRRTKASPQNAQAQLDVSFDLSQIGDYYDRRGDLNAALEYYQQALEVRERLAAADPSNMQLRERIVFMRGNIGNTLRRLGRFKDAGEEFQGAIDSGRTLAEDRSNDFSIGVAYMGRGSMKNDMASREALLKAKVLREQACADYAQASGYFRKMLSGGRSINSDWKRAVDELENDIKRCPGSISAQK